MSTTRPADGLRPVDRVAVYDAPGGRPRAWLPSDIRGTPLTVPVVRRESGWVAVLLPSINRTIGWIPPGGWILVPLHDQLLVHRREHRLIWLRDDVVVRSWPVTLGRAETPTPLGRTFILGQSTLPGEVYADTNVFALGAVPDNPSAVPDGLRGAHIGIHTWYHDRTLAQDITDGCIRLTKSGQRQLLRELRPGTEVVVLD